MRQFLRAKIHGVKVTQALPEYEGSLGIDRDWMERVGIAPFEAVEVYNMTNGARLKTYAIELPSGSHEISSNGAAAHLVRPNDRIIIACYQFVADQTKALPPKILVMGEDGSIKKSLRGMEVL